MFHCYRSLELI